MSFAPKLLASGQLANAKGTLYTTPNGLRARITTISYYNTTGGALTVDTFISSGSSRQIDSHSVPANSRYICIDETAPLLLDFGEIIQGNTSAGTSVNYFIFGELEQKVG